MGAKTFKENHNKLFAKNPAAGSPCVPFDTNLTEKTVFLKVQLTRRRISLRTMPLALTRPHFDFEGGKICLK